MSIIYIVVIVSIFIAEIYKCEKYISKVFENPSRSILHKDAFICPTLCHKVLCPQLLGCPEELILKNGSLCGCCNKCISYADENDFCMEIENIVHARKKAVNCKTGLKCQKGICTTLPSQYSCGTISKWRKELRNNPDPDNLFSKDLWIPECDKSGKYNILQCKRKKCLCFDENGNILSGQKERDIAANMTCGCSKTMEQLKRTDPSHWMIKPQEHCSMSGDFNELQCIDTICYCANSTTGVVLGRVTMKQFMYLLPCYNRLIDSTRYETQCELQLLRTRWLRYRFHRKNVNIVGLENIDCDLDGTFSPKQCLTDRCVCADRKGTGMKSFDIERNKGGAEMIMRCNCARDEYDISSTHAHYRRMHCDAGGNFAPLQCFDHDNCYCVDDDGDTISRRLTNLEALTVDCVELRNQLQNPGNIATTDDYDYY